MLAGCVPCIFLIFYLFKIDKIVYSRFWRFRFPSIDCSFNLAVSRFRRKRETALVVETFFPCGNHWFSCRRVSKHDTHLSMRIVF